MRKIPILIACSGVVAGVIAYGIKRLNEDLKDAFVDIDIDVKEDENEEIPERHYITLNFDNVKEKLSKAKESIKEEVEEINQNRERIVEILKNATGEVKDVILKKQSENDKEELKEEYKEEVKKVSYDDYFESDIKKEYSYAINLFLFENGKNSLISVRKEIFKEDGEFDFKRLKERFAEKYNDIARILKTEVFSLPISILPLENYLNEIDLFEQTIDIPAKVKAILSYWMTINETVIGNVL